MRMIILAIVVLTTAEIAASTGPVPRDCMRCICTVESGCRMPDPVCHLDGWSQSCGPYQIKFAYWRDVTGGREEEDWMACTQTFSCSESAVQGYMNEYATWSRLGHAPTCEDFARIHNGGPNGIWNPRTKKYWKKVRNCLGQ